MYNWRRTQYVEAMKANDKDAARTARGHGGDELASQAGRKERAREDARRTTAMGYRRELAGKATARFRRPRRRPAKPWRQW